MDEKEKKERRGMVRGERVSGMGRREEVSVPVGSSWRGEPLHPLERRMKRCRDVS
tara:strand:+ start:878 stop:1042 length:165 start_codon:yes stop_codon:yes gene_type:complete